MDLSALLAQVRQWFRDGDITFLHAETERLFEAILDVVANSAGTLNFIDALLVILEREGVLDDVASFAPSSSAAAANSETAIPPLAPPRAVQRACAVDGHLAVRGAADVTHIIHAGVSVARIFPFPNVAADIE